MLNKIFREIHVPVATEIWGILKALFQNHFPTFTFITLEFLLKDFLAILETVI